MHDRAEMKYAMGEGEIDVCRCAERDESALIENLVEDYSFVPIGQACK